MTAKLFPQPARQLADAAVRAGWVVSVGPDAADPSLYNVHLAPLGGDVTYWARWKSDGVKWRIRFAERRHTPAEGPHRTDEILLDRIHEAIKASVGVT